MKLIIDIDENVFTRLFDCGVDTSSEDREVIDRAVRNGKSYEERPHEKWIYHEDWKNEGECPYECSSCGRTYDYAMNFCGNCGADMRGGRQ